MKKTVLYDDHVEQGAKMAEFAGYEMPIQYTRIQDEHMAVRSKAGIFDVSHMGEILVEGEGALTLLEKLTTNKVASLSIGQAQYTLMTNPEGGIMDDLLIYRLGNKNYLLVVNAGNTAKVWNWIIENKTYDTETRNISADTGLIALQGPRSADILQNLTSINVTDILFYHFKRGEVGGVSDVLISATGYTGSGGFELYVPNEFLLSVWSELCDAGVDKGLMRAGLGARETLRLEMGYCLYGNDIDEDITPFEAGLGWITKMEKDEFTGKDALMKQKSKAVVRTLKGFILNDKRVPRSGYTIHNMDQKKIGEVTSGTFSPCLQKPIGLGYINTSLMESDKTILVSNGIKFFQGEIIKPPFVNVKDYVS